MEKKDSETSGSVAASADGGENQPLSKNQQKKIRKKLEWEAGREDRKILRKQKIKAQKARRREAIRENPALRVPAPKPHVRAVPVPLAIILDCGFESLMTDNERTSLSSQVTRSYSDLRVAPFRPQLVVSDFGGHLKDRFDNALQKTHANWKNVTFVEEDLQAGIEAAGAFLRNGKAGEPKGALKAESPPSTEAEPDANHVQDSGEPETVYLTAESDNTLTKLKPGSIYIIGGLVDRNRHKGVCHAKAEKMGLKTAKLPIGAYMQMNSRYVLTTNHVVTIMAKWLECGDWGKAFMEVMPKRKGGKLKSEEEEDPPELENEEAAGDCQ